MTRASNGAAERRRARAAGEQARQRGYRQHIAHAQLDFFGAAAPADPLFGVAVKLPNTCSKCADLVAIIGPGKPRHSASLLCRSCGLHRGWVPRANYTFLNEVINKFGAPNEPIVFRIRSTKPEQDDDGVSFVQDGIKKGKMMPITVGLYSSKHPKRHVWTGLAKRVRRRKRRTAKLQTKTELQLQLDLFTPDVPTTNGTT